MWVVDAVRFAVAGALGVAVLAGWASIPLLVAIGFLLGTGQTLFDMFAGGRITTQLTAPAKHRVELTTQVPLILGLTPRQMLEQALEQRSSGRLHLDPAGTR